MAMPDESSPYRALMMGLARDIGEDVQPEQKSEVESLIDRFQAHDAAERGMLKEYEDTATNSSDGGVRFLMTLIIEEERRHDEFLHAMADEVRRSLVWDGRRHALPAISATGAERAQLLAKATRFLEAERSGKRQLDQLEGVIRRFDRGEGILSLLAQMMAFDTQKHIAILDYIRKNLQG
jgi:hypothetical protein